MTPQRRPGRATLANVMGAPVQQARPVRRWRWVVCRHSNLPRLLASRGPQQKGIATGLAGWAVLVHKNRQDCGRTCSWGHPVRLLYRYAWDADGHLAGRRTPAGYAAAPDWRRSPARPCAGVAPERRRVTVRGRCCRSRAFLLLPMRLMPPLRITPFSDWPTEGQDRAEHDPSGAAWQARVETRYPGAGRWFFRDQPGSRGTKRGAIMFSGRRMSASSASPSSFSSRTSSSTPRPLSSATLAMRVAFS